MSLNRHQLNRGITSSRTEVLSIGEISKRSGVNIGTIRYYERIKVLPAPPRTASGRRAYDARDLRILGFIRRSRELNFSLDEIRALLRLGAPENGLCRDVRKVAAHRLEDIRSRIILLAQIERLLAGAIGECSGDPVSTCPVLEILDGQSVNSSQRRSRGINGRR
jgi:MerR family transcriptional regulator, mercuric resistance operon regulatory protein